MKRRRVLTKAEAKFKHEVSAKAKGEKAAKRSRSRDNNARVADGQHKHGEEQDDFEKTNIEEEESFVVNSSRVLESGSIPGATTQDSNSDVMDESNTVDCQLLGSEILSELHTMGVSVEDLSQNDLETFLKNIGKRKNIDADTVSKIFREYLENEKRKIAGLITNLLGKEFSQNILKEDKDVEPESSHSLIQQTEHEKGQEILESFDIKENISEELHGRSDSDESEDGKLGIVMPRHPAVAPPRFPWPAEEAADHEPGTSYQQLLKSQIDLFKQDSDGDTILHLAIVHCHSFVRKLIEMMKSETLDVQNKRGQTALHLAVILQQGNCIRHLIASDASVAVVDCEGDTPLHIACRIGSIDLVTSLLTKLLVAPSVGIQTAMRKRNFNGDTPLHVAMAQSLQTGNDELVRLLVENRCDIDSIEGKSGKTCLYMALEHEKYDLANYLIHWGADVNGCAFSGTSPLHLACQAGNIGMVEKLLKKDAALTAKNAEYESPKDVATTEEIRRLLDKAMKRERRKKYKKKDD